LQGILISFEQILILFIYIVVGFILKRTKLINIEGDKTLSNLTNYIALPAMLLTSMRLEVTPQVLWNTLLVIVLSIVLTLLVFYISRYFACLAGLKDSSSDAFQITFTFANVGYLGYPIALALFGNEGLYYFAIFGFGHNLILYSLGIMLLDLRRKNGFSWRFLYNPVLLGTVFGFLLNLFSIELPYLVHQPLAALGGTAIPLALVLVGSALADQSLLDIFKDKAVYCITLGKNILAPLISFALISFLPLDGIVFKTVVLEMAMPVAAATIALGQVYESDYHLMSNAVAFSTFFSFLTIPLWLIIIS